jgi:DHA2 family multidrug resistance protein-like MFS transporter
VNFARPRQKAAINPTEGLPPTERAFALVALSLAIGMATLDTAIVNTALPTIASDLDTTGAKAIWVINTYQIVVVAALLPLASLGEILGHRRVYLAGIVLFTITSLACGLAWSLPTLVGARALQGLGGAAIMSVNTALVRFVYPARMMGRGLGMNALIVALAFTIGPTVASGILSVASWHWLFLVNGPVGLVALAFAIRTLPSTARAEHGFDAVAALFCAGLLALVILGIGAVAHRESWIAVGLEWAGAAAFGAALAWRQAGHPAPMLAVDLFKNPAFALSALTAICAFATQGLAFVSLPFLLQDVMGYSAVDTGLIITPWPAIVALLGPIAGRLSDRHPPGLLGGVGLFVLSCGMITLALMPRDPAIPDIAWRMVVCGAGFGFFQAPNLRALMTSAPQDRSGGASGIVATARLVGQSTGAALVALCLTVSRENGPELALWTGAAFAGTGSVVSFLRLLPRGPAA